MLSRGDCLEANLAENQLITKIEEARAFAQAIIDTVREPVLVLDQDLRVVTANRSFYRTFKVRPEATEGRLLYPLGDGQWDIPKPRLLLEKIVPEHGVMEDYEAEHEFPNVGPRTMCLYARKVDRHGHGLCAGSTSRPGAGKRSIGPAIQGHVPAGARSGERPARPA